MTHTYAILEVSAAAYAEIRAKLEAADYGHAFHRDGDGEVIDMHGIALRSALVHMDAGKDILCGCEFYGAQFTTVAADVTCPACRGIIAASEHADELRKPLCVGMAPHPRATGEPCCERAGVYNGFGSDGPLLFTCPKRCTCHD